MGLFTKNPEAKARRTQEREEQQKKEKAVPPPYTHTPTHALNDALLSVPNAFKGTDKRKLKEAHRYRLEREVSALAAGSDTNVTNIPAKYWQGQPLPAQFEAPTPAKLRKMALSRPSLKGKKIELSEDLTAQKQAQMPTDEGYASGHSMGKRSRQPSSSDKGKSREPMTTQYQQDEAAEAGREAELERLRSKIRELEGKQRGKQNERNLAGPPSVLTRSTDQDASSSNPPVVAGPHSAPPCNVGLVDGFQSRTSSSERWEGMSSRSSNKKSSEGTPSTPPSIMQGSQGGGTDRYDWAMHWARLNARTEEERAKLPPAVNPREGPAPVPEDKACYSSLDEFSARFLSPTETKPPSRPRGRQKTKAPERLVSVSPDSNATIAGSSSKDYRREPEDAELYNRMAELDFGFGSTTTSSTLRPDNHSSRTVSHINKAEARRKRQ